MPVFIPIAPGSKRPMPVATKWSDDNPPVEKWWENVPEDVNKALRLDGLVVIDCDSQAEVEAFEAQLREWGEDCLVQVRTAKGVHFYWRLPAGVSVNPGPVPGHRIDVKSGQGHYVLVPPSINATGIEYRFRGPGMASQEPSEAPRALLDWITVLRAVTAPAATGAASGEDVIPAGARNSTLTSFAGLMRRLGLSDSAVSRVLNGLNHSLTEEPLADEEVAAIVHSSARWDAEDFEIILEHSEELLTRLSTMDLPPPGRWLWKPYLPLGRLVLVDGAEGIGKGMFCAHAATQLTSGEWGEKGTVLWMATEDDPEEDIQRRMYAAGWNVRTHDDVLFFNEWPQFPKHIEPLRQLIIEHGTKLVIMDPGRSFIRREDDAPMSYNDEAAIRPALQKLQKLAKETDCTIIFVHHWNKDSQGSTRTRAGGSGAFAQVVRHRVTLAKVGNGPAAEWAFEVQKSNIIEAGHLCAYELEAVERFDTARWLLGEPIKDFSDLGSWLKSKEAIKDGGSADLDSSDKLAWWARSALPAGGMLPPRDDLAKLTRIPRNQIEDSLLALEEQGLLIRQSTGVGTSHRWVWKG